ncbi:hypothetical protein [Mesorhizobium sp. LCM 4577]|uniref:hypothetical protein n=1 Tax=Mesorhizobium sp. LCM 4577 TaxID=1848288 RepID=UPI0010421ABE|nr:hypothetical protein [Mesorhizobium sp. LCM 4577]
MADPDNSTTLHPVTRRSLLARTAIAMAGSKPKAGADSVFKDTNRMILLWRLGENGKPLTKMTVEQQRLERKLSEIVAFSM